MALVYKDRVRETTTTHSGTGAFTLAGAVSKYRAFSSIGNGNTCVYVAEGGSASEWEVGIGTYSTTGPTLSRTVVLDSSNSGSLVNFTSGVHNIGLVNDTSQQLSDLGSSAGTNPGGRLTLTTGVPVTTSDVASSTSIYYTPYLHGYIPLWDGYRWVNRAFSEITHAFGTLTSGLPYDMFAYWTGSAVTLEKVAWTSDTARATAVTVQNGRKCKSGDATRLFLGTVRSTSTQGASDTLLQRYLFNEYNRRPRPFEYQTGDYSNNYVANGFRQWNNDTTCKVEVMAGSDDIVYEETRVNCLINSSVVSSVSSQCGAMWNATSDIDSYLSRFTIAAPVASTSWTPFCLGTGILPANRKSNYNLIQRNTSAQGSGTRTWNWGGIKGVMIG